MNVKHNPLRALAITALALSGCRQSPAIPAGTLPAQAVPANPAEQTDFVGFDRNLYPGDDRLADLHRHFAFTGYWLTPPPGETTTTWIGKRRILRDTGFGFLVLANGKLDAQIKAAKLSPRRPRQAGRRPGHRRRHP